MKLFNWSFNMKKISAFIIKNKIVIICVVLIFSLFLSSYQNAWRHIFSNSTDLSKEKIALAATYYGSKIFVWYGSFSHYAILLLLMIPILITDYYASDYFLKKDIFIIYRQGFNKYYFDSLFRIVKIMLTVAVIPIIVYFGLVCIFFQSNNYAIEGASGIAPFIPTIYIRSNFVLDILNKNIIYLYLFSSFLMIIATFIYGIFSYSIGIYIKQKYIRFVAPIIAMVMLDFILNSFIFNLEDSLFFGLFNQNFIMNPLYGLGYLFFILIISVIMLVVHYHLRRNNG